MNLRKCCEEIRHTKSLRKTPFFLENNLPEKKNVRKSYKTTYDSLLADLGKHQTRMQKFVRKTYDIVTCRLWTKVWRFYEDYTKVRKKFCELGPCSVAFYAPLGVQGCGYMWNITLTKWCTALLPQIFSRRSLRVKWNMLFANILFIGYM